MEGLVGPVIECDHREGNNPRRWGWCVKCGREMPKVDETRDWLTEKIVLKRVADEVERRTGENAEPFIHRVQSRLDWGAKLYGDLAFLHDSRDNLLELEDETADAAVYALFQIHVLNREQAEAPDGVHHFLFESMVHAAISDLFARRARRALQEAITTLVRS